MCGMVKKAQLSRRPSFMACRPGSLPHHELTNMVTGEKNRAQNCLTVSNLKLDDVFSDVFGKSARSITEYILAHPGETWLEAALQMRRRAFR